MVAFIKKNWFLLGIVLALVLGFAFSEAAVTLNSGSRISTAVVVIMFIIMGLTLPSEALKAGLTDYRLHLFVQLFQFIITPLFYFLITIPLAGVFGYEIRTGILALACLPATISSCILFTQLSGGNAVGAMFNAAVANIAGVFLSPLLLSLLLGQAGTPMPPEEVLKVLRSLTLKMLLPITAGQAARFLIRDWAMHHKKKLSTAGSICILLVVLFSFAETAGDPEFVATIPKMVLPFGFLAVSYLILAGISFGGTRIAGFSRENRIAALFASTQKTLAMGVPFVTTYFASQPEIIGTVLLPIIFYHPWQLFMAGIFNSRLTAANPKAEAPAADTSVAEPSTTVIEKSDGGTSDE